MLKKVKGPDIVQTGQVIFVRVGKDDGVEAANISAEHLATKVRRSVDDDGGGGGLYENAGSKSFISFIGRSAHFAGAGYHRNTGTGAGTQESDF
jgi:hypothetical protein